MVPIQPLQNMGGQFYSDEKSENFIRAKPGMVLVLTTYMIVLEVRKKCNVINHACN